MRSICSKIVVLMSLECCLLHLEKDEGDIRSMITGGTLVGERPLISLQEGLEKNYDGSMKLMAETFSGLTSTLSDTMTEVSNAYGEGYNATRSRGLEAEIGAYGGDLGAVMQNLNRITGENDAFRENLAEQYTREALSAVLLGRRSPCSARRTGNSSGRCGPPSAGPTPATRPRETGRRRWRWRS